MSDSPRRKLHVPRNLRLLLSAGVTLFVVEYFVFPKSAYARHNLRFLSQVNPFLVVVAVALEIGAIWAYCELTARSFTPTPRGATTFCASIFRDSPCLTSCRAAPPSPERWGSLLQRDGRARLH
jgi:hypothetical protein